MSDKIAAIYRRVSTTEQAAGDKASLQRQADECRRLADRDGFQIGEGLDFVEAVSGAADVRPEFDRMRDAAKAGKFTRLYVWAADRLSRAGMVATLQVVAELAGHGIEVHTVTDGPLTHELIVGIRAWAAAEERKKIRERTQGSLKAMRDKGLWTQGMAPFGFRRRTDGVLLWDDKEIEVVRRIYALTIAGQGRVVVAGKLNREGILPPLVELRVPGRVDEKGDHKPVRIRTNDERIGSSLSKLEAMVADMGASYWRAVPTWNESTVEKIITNPIYTGKMTSGGTVAIDPGPPLSPSEWQAAQDARKARARQRIRPRTHKLATGLIECRSCGRAYVSQASGRNQSHRYYTCSGRRAGTGCTSPMVRQELVHDSVAAKVTTLLANTVSRTHLRKYLDREGRERLEELQTQLRADHERLTDLEAATARLSDALVELRAAGARGEDIIKKIAAAETEITEVRNRLDRLVKEISAVKALKATKEDDLDELAFWAEHLLHVDPENRPDGGPVWFPDPAEIVKLVVRRIFAEADGRLSIDLDRSPAAILAVVEHVTQAATRFHRQFDQRLSDIASGPSQPDNVISLEDEKFLRDIRNMLSNKGGNAKPLA